MIVDATSHAKNHGAPTQDAVSPHTAALKKRNFPHPIHRHATERTDARFR